MKTRRLALVWICAAVICFLVTLTSTPVIGAEASDYRISPGDKLFIEVFGERDLQREVAVSASGEITFPLLGNVKVRGLTAVQLQEKLKDDLGRDYLVDPQVTVSLRDYRKRTVSVLGQVGQPGLVELPAEQNLSILEAIAMRGGFTRLAKKSGIQVTRQGVARPYRFSEEELKRNSDPDKAFYLKHGDVIMVEESNW
jgi:polysaccharide export outer membrane protein